MPKAPPAKPPWPFAGEVTMTADLSKNQWVKRIRGKRHNFGVLSDPRAALERYRQIGPALHRGEMPWRDEPVDDITLGEVCALYLRDKATAVELQTLSVRTLDCYRDTVAILLELLGRDRVLGRIPALEWSGLPARTGYGPTNRRKFVTWTRSIFRWAHESGVIAAPPRYGPGFTGSTAKERRELRNRSGARLFTPAEIRRLLDACEHVQLRAMILLGINGGFGPKDCGDLPLDALDFKAKLVDFPRIKTAIPRTVPLWPETVKALEAAIAERPTPKPAFRDRVFLTRLGAPWVVGRGNSIKYPIRDAFKAAKIAREGAGFYDLKRTFRTVADETGDQHAIHRIIGHQIPGMSGIYVQQVKTPRLRAVTNHVRRWVFPPSRKRTT